MHTLNQYISSHTTTRFAKILVVADIGLKIIQQSNTSKYMAVKTTHLDRLISETDWLKQPKNVMRPIRDEIIQFQFLPKSTMTDLSTESYDLYCPNLILLITFLCLTPSLRSPILLLTCMGGNCMMTNATFNEPWMHQNQTMDASKSNLEIVTGTCRCRTLKCQSCKS